MLIQPLIFEICVICIMKRFWFPREWLIIYNKALPNMQIANLCLKKKRTCNCKEICNDFTVVANLFLFVCYLPCTNNLLIYFCNSIRKSGLNFCSVIVYSLEVEGDSQKLCARNCDYEKKTIFLNQVFSFLTCCR